MSGYGWQPIFVEGSKPTAMHRAMAEAMERAVGQIRAFQQQARSSGQAFLPNWPMNVLRSPKGWSGPSEIHGDKLEGFWRSHLVPLSKPRQDPEELAALEAWMRSYRPEGLFYQEGRLRADLRELSPKGNKRMGSNPHANGGLLRKNLTWPSVDELAVIVEVPGQTEAENTYPLGQLLRELIRHNQGSYRLFGPDETHSNRLQAVCDATKKVWMANYLPEDLDGSELSMDGAVVEMLSEHTLVGMMEGYLLTGR